MWTVREGSARPAPVCYRLHVLRPVAGEDCRSQLTWTQLVQVKRRPRRTRVPMEIYMSQHARATAHPRLATLDLGCYPRTMEEYHVGAVDSVDADGLLAALDCAIYLSRKDEAEIYLESLEGFVGL